MKSMKQYIIILFALLVLTGCEEWTNSAASSKATYLPLVALQGEGHIDLECNALGFEDAGCIMTEGGEALEVTATNYGLYFDGHWVDGTGTWNAAHWEYDHSEPSGPDLYDISYSAVNVDGIPGVSARSVYWPQCNGDLVTSIAGVYKASVRRNGVTGGLNVDNLGPFIIKDLGNNVYALSDGFGGWYEHGRGFGSYDGPALGATVTANDIPTNDFTFGPTFSISVFHGKCELTAFSVDPVARTINFTSIWDSNFDGVTNYTFTVTLTQCPDGVSCWD